VPKRAESVNDDVKVVKRKRRTKAEIAASKAELQNTK
jgi:hypothetical protein